MNPAKKSAIALAALIIVSVGHAQQPAPSGTTTTGRLGQRYVGASFGVANFKDTPERGHDTSIGVNLPITPSIDVDFGYSYQWLGNSPVDLTGNSVDAGATLYKSWRGVKPYASASLGYSWSEASYAGSSIESNDGFYVVSVGFEAPVGPIVLTPAIGLYRPFESDSDTTSFYGVDAHHWFTSKIGARAGVSYADYGDGFSSWDYRIGLRVKF